MCSFAQTANAPAINAPAIGELFAADNGAKLVQPIGSGMSVVAGSELSAGIATAKLRDQVGIEGSLGWFSGSGPDAIGRFSDSDFLYVRLKYFF